MTTHILGYRAELVLYDVKGRRLFIEDAFNANQDDYARVNVQAVADAEQGARQAGRFGGARSPRWRIEEPR